MSENQIGVRKDRSLVGRLVRSAMLWTLPILALSAFALTWVYQSSTLRIYDDPLESAITSLIANAEIDTTSGELTLLRQPLDPRYQQAFSGRYWLVGYLQVDGQVDRILASRSLYETSLTLPADVTTFIQGNPGADIRAYTEGPDENEPLRLVARSVILPGMNDRPVVMIAAADSRPATHAIRRFGFFAFGLMSALSIALVVAVLTQVRVGLKPLFDLQAQVANVREGRSVSVEGDYPREIQPLANELNSLIGHNKDVVERARTHVANLAHALKTPLAVLLNEAAQSKMPLANLVTRQSQVMKQQVDHHLQRARAAARGQSIGISTPVSDTLTSLERTLIRIYGYKDIQFTLTCPPDLIFRGEKRDLDDMVGNLMDNACKWTENHVRIHAGIMDTDPAMIVISVEDNGPGLKEAEFSEAIKRGARLDETTPGTGFGLAIVDDLARAYKGDLVLSTSDLGGLMATLTLPGRL